MERRRVLGMTAAAMAGATGALWAEPTTQGATAMQLGLLIGPSVSAAGAEESVRRVKELGFATCFLSLDAYIGGFTRERAEVLGGLLRRYGVRATTVEVVGPKPLVWDFLKGPATIGLVPRATRSARMAALTGVSDFAKMLGVPQVQTHCGFIPEDPADVLYGETVTAIAAVAKHCEGNGQRFLMETGQETPTTMARVLRDVGRENLGVGLDTANLILYGKANPVDAVTMLGRQVMSVHAKDGRWPTNPSVLGEEVLIGRGDVDFKQVFTKLRAVGYQGAVTIERETDGPQQIEDVKREKLYLERVLRSL